MKVYLVDAGVLLTKEDVEFDCYAVAYDKKHGYYDKTQYYVKTKEKALEDAKEYVKKGVEKTYVIISETDISDEFDFDEGYVEDEKYSVEDIVYSVAKINGEIVENFVEGQPKEDSIITFKSIEHYDAFSDSVIFWCDATNIPQKYVEKAKKIDKENYSSDCFGVCVVLDVDGFGICRGCNIEAEDCELYYVDNTGEKNWMEVVLSNEEAKTFYAGCMEEISTHI